VGTGSFKWVGYKQDQWIKLEAVDKHFLNTPHIKTLKIVLVPEPSTRLAMLKAGEADMGDLIGVHAQQIKSEPGFKLHWVKYISGTVLIFADLVDPETPSPFHDIRVRQAVSMSIDREIICKKILFNTSEPWGDVMSPITLGHDPTLKPAPYDPEKAKKLLDEAGYPKGFETEINTVPSNVYVDALAASLDEIGIKVKINKYETGAYLQAFFTKKLRGLISYGSWYDAERSAPADLSDFYSKGAYHAYNPTDEIDDVLKKANHAETDKELEEWGRKISKTIRNSMINTVLWANHRVHALGPKIKSWSPAIGADPAIDYETIELK
jgi:peptide/nickel transport system substrate-binding protein